MWKALNAVAVTLPVAVVCIVPAALLARYLPPIFGAGLSTIAVGAWLSGLVSWWLATTMVRNEQKAMQEAVQNSTGHGRNGRAVGMTVGVLALAVAAVAAIHIFGDGLLY